MRCIIVSEDEMKYANRRTRYKKRWQKDVPLSQFAFNGQDI